MKIYFFRLLKVRAWLICIFVMSIVKTKQIQNHEIVEAKN